MIKKFIIIFNLLFTFLAVPSKAAFDINARTAILQDFLSGEILFEKEIDSVIYPASMTKIMTSIVVFDLLKSGDLSLDDAPPPIPLSFSLATVLPRQWI